MTPEEMRQKIKRQWEREEQQELRCLMWRMAGHILIIAALAVIAWVAAHP